MGGNHALKSWKAVIETTLDLEYTTVRISATKAHALDLGTSHGCLLTLEAGFDVEIVKVVRSAQGILTLERGQEGTTPAIWPAGTVLEARISSKTLHDLRIDPKHILAMHEEVLLAANGDLITKVREQITKQA
jgi:hypothetical protein